MKAVYKLAYKMVVYVLGMKEIRPEFDSRLLHVSPVMGNLIGGVMPKEIIAESFNLKKSKRGAQIEVRWGADHHNSIQLVVDRKTPFWFINENEPVEKSTLLAVSLYSEKQIDALIDALQRAKKKTFA